jgi:hypothetical protein
MLFVACMEVEGKGNDAMLSSAWMILQSQRNNVDVSE